MFDFGLYTQVSDSGPHGFLVSVLIFIVLKQESSPNKNIMQAEHADNLTQFNQKHDKVLNISNPHIPAAIRL